MEFASRASGRFSVIVSANGGTTVRRRSIHHPNPASAPPIIGPSARRTGLLSPTPVSSVPNE